MDRTCDPLQNVARDANRTARNAKTSPATQTDSPQCKNVAMHVRATCLQSSEDFCTAGKVRWLAGSIFALRATFFNPQTSALHCFQL